MPAKSIHINDLDVSFRIDGDGPLVTLIHGVGSAKESWDPVVDALKHRFQFLRYDLRGHGETSKPPGPYSIELFADDFSALLAALAIKRTHLVGFSLGGLIAQCVALRSPAMVDKLVILSAVANKSPEEMEKLRQRADALEKNDNRPNMEAALDRWFTPEFRERNPALVADRVALSAHNDPKAFAAAYRAFVEGDFAEELASIRHPTLVMTGEHDPGSNVRMARFMHESIADSELYIIPRLRHSVLVEGPDIVADRIGRFLG